MLLSQCTESLVGVHLWKAHLHQQTLDGHLTLATC